MTNTKKQKLKILSRVWNCRYTMLYKRRRERNRGEKKKEKSHRNYKKNYMYKIDDIYQKDKIKNLEQSLEFQKYNVKKKRRRKRKRGKKKTKVAKIIKKIQVQNGYQIPKSIN